MRPPKKKSKRKLTITLIVILLMVAAAVIVYVLYSQTKNQTDSTDSLAFHFDSSKAPGWWSADTYHPKLSDLPADSHMNASDLPAASINIMEGTQSNPGNCFVSYNYWANNSTSPEDALKKMTDYKPGDDQQVEQANIIPLVMKTSDGNHSFDLHQYNLVGNPGGQMERGNEFGFFRTGTGYMDIRSYCPTVEDLSKTLPVLSAVSFTF